MGSTVGTRRNTKTCGRKPHKQNISQSSYLPLAISTTPLQALQTFEKIRMKVLGDGFALTNTHSSPYNQRKTQLTNTSKKKLDGEGRLWCYY
jgi:hypothetical protein